MLPTIFRAGRGIKWAIASKWTKVILRSYGVKVGERLKVGIAPHIIKNQNGAVIEIGDKVTIHNELSQNPAGINRRTILAAPNPGSVLIIGNKVSMSGATIYASKSVVLEDNVLLGADSVIYDTDFYSTDPHHRKDIREGFIKSAPVLIKRNAWIGARAMVLKGVTVGEDAVVAAGAIVTKDVPNGAITAGIPAKVIGWVPGYERTSSVR
jgi:acetyltransferase-like isoleucine patch superfamily enzyme